MLSDKVKSRGEWCYIIFLFECGLKEMFFCKGPVLNYREGGGGATKNRKRVKTSPRLAKNWERCRYLLVPPEDMVKPFVPPSPLKGMKPFTRPLRRHGLNLTLKLPENLIVKQTLREIIELFHNGTCQLLKQKN